MNKIYYIENYDTLNKITHYYFFKEKLEIWEYDINSSIENVSSNNLEFYGNSLNSFLSALGYRDFELERII